MSGAFEFRDPIHTFVQADAVERAVIDSPPVQRLRQIHQLALSYLVYPGATHRRFEHSLGVMELAGRAFDVLTRPAGYGDAGNVTADIAERVNELRDRRHVDAARATLRVAALCHDIGHLPFSHAAESLLPAGKNHEDVTIAWVYTPLMEQYWRQLPGLAARRIARAAAEADRFPDEPFSDWERILNEIITGDAFGVDRIDYLLRDSYHAGVAYGQFDHNRLIDNLRILPSPVDRRTPVLGIMEGGLRSAEAMLLARYFMYTQVYYHPVRVSYNLHLRDFLAAWLPGGLFPIEPEAHLAITDAEVLAELARQARADSDTPIDERGPAWRIAARQHYKLVWDSTYARHDPDATEMVHRGLLDRFGAAAVHRDSKTASGGAIVDFPVRLRNGSVVSATSISEILTHLPKPAYDYVFVRPDLVGDARSWVREQYPVIAND